MLTIELRPEVAEQLRQAAEQREVSIETLVNEWLENQIWEEWNRKISEEARRFRERHAELYEHYAGKYIAMQNGVVLDVDDDLLILHDRVRARYGDVPILMTPVNEEPIQTLRVWSNRYAQGKP